MKIYFLIISVMFIESLKILKRAGEPLLMREYEIKKANSVPFLVFDAKFY